MNIKEEEYECAGKWQDIKTAPKDGTTFIGVVNDKICIYKYEDQPHHKKPNPYFKSRSGNYLGVIWDRSRQPTHWQPLPEPPKEYDE